MIAFLSIQGTALAQTALCDYHATAQHNIERVLFRAKMAGDWNGLRPTDCTGNEILRCQICGTFDGTIATF